MQISRRTFSALVVTALAGSVQGCGLLDTDELLTFNIPLTYTLPVTIPIAYPPSGRLSDLRAQGSTSVPIQSYVPVSVDQLQGVDSRLTNQDIVQEVRIDSVTMVVESNTLTDVALQPFEFRVGEPGVQVLAAELAGGDFENAMIAAVVPAQSPGFTGSVPGQIVDANRSPIGRRIAELDFGIGIGTSLLLDGQIPEGGKAEVKFTIRLVFVVKPLGN